MPNAKLEKLKERKKKLAEQIKKAETVEKSRTRREDTRKKIVVGGLVLEMMKKDEALAKRIHSGLDASLKRAIDRELFTLPVLEEKAKDGKAPKKEAVA